MKLNREKRIEIQKEIKESKLNIETKNLLNKILDESKLGLKLYYEESEEMVKNENGHEIPISKLNYIYFEEDEGKELNFDDGKSHLLIEGDNYLALKHLKRIGQKVDVIYIDPPYNTGNEFTYNDSLVRKDDSFKHSYWLSFMRKRLEVARDLLSDKGVIFVSIDDNEQAYLKVLMDEIFGEVNFISNLVWLKRNAQNDANNFQKNYEYILVYCKEYDKDLIAPNKKINDKKGEGIGLTIGGGFKSKSLKHHKDTGQTIYWNKQNGEIEIRKDYIFEKVVNGDERIEDVYIDDIELISNGYTPIRPPRFEYNGKMNLGRWTWGVEKMIENSDKLLIKENNGRITVMRRDDREYSILPFNNYIDDIPSSQGTKDLKSVHQTNFSNPKSVKLIERLLSFSNKKDPVILDFFAGSGTTLEAVQKMNKYDDGNRRAILITLGSELNSENIASNITYERAYRTNIGKGTSGESDFKWLDKNEPFKENLKYLKVSMLDKLDGNLNIINENKRLYKKEFDVDLSIELIADE